MNKKQLEHLKLKIDKIKSKLRAEMCILQALKHTNDEPFFYEIDKGRFSECTFSGKFLVKNADGLMYKMTKNECVKYLQVKIKQFNAEIDVIEAEINGVYNK